MSWASNKRRWYEAARLGDGGRGAAGGLLALARARCECSALKAFSHGVYRGSQEKRGEVKAGGRHGRWPPASLFHRQAGSGSQ